MRAVFIIVALVSTGYCFDFSTIETGNANWLPTGESVADITVHLRSEVKGLFKREDSFPFRYVSPKVTMGPNGHKQNNYIGGKQTHTPFDASGNKGWIYIKEISEHGARVRCVVREAKEDGKILYEREFVIPWTTKAFLLDTDIEHFDGRITVIPKNKT
jgi:hypothetical protein